MFITKTPAVLFILVSLVWLNKKSEGQSLSKTVVTIPGLTGDHISPGWKKAIEPRMSAEEFDSMSALRRNLTSEENDWFNLIKSKTDRWNTLRDSLSKPFSLSKTPDTIFVLLGAFGSDDAFTYGLDTVCMDLTATQNNYGAAFSPKNSNLIDRIFAHEFTHLLHKEWMLENGLVLRTFKDSLLWECIYEGLGMYRSMPPRWMPTNGGLPDTTKTALEELCPVFVDRLIKANTSEGLTDMEKRNIEAGLSRGKVLKKWGAFPVAIWLALEANGDDKKLIPWINHGPESIILLAKKYLTDANKNRFETVFGAASN